MSGLAGTRPNAVERGLNMRFRDREILPIRTIPKTIEAQRFNRARLALLRLGSPLRLRLSGLRGVDVILDHRIWLSVDRIQNDLPIMALTDFATANRSDLHTPVSCHLHLYHYHAGLVMSLIMDALDQALEERLFQLRVGEDGET